MICGLTLEGFKSFLFDQIEFRALTVLTGLNSSGKSSIAQALLMLDNKQQNREILLDGYGGFEELQNPFVKNMNIEVELEDDTVFGLNTEENNAAVFPEVIYIAADRFGPQTQIPIYLEGNYKLGKNGENVLKVIDYYSVQQPTTLPPALWFDPQEEEGENFEQALKGWLSVISPNTEFVPHIQRQTDSSYATFNGHRAKNVGFGLSYALPVITALLLGSITPNSLVIVENPEAHIHPRGQTEIARLIARTVESGCQVVLETHSDHIINGIRIYAKENEGNFHEKVLIHWLELNAKKNTKREAISIDKHGRSNNYPQGFFDQFEINARKLL